MERNLNHEFYGSLPTRKSTTVCWCICYLLISVHRTQTERIFVFCFILPRKCGIEELRLEMCWLPSLMNQLIKHVRVTNVRLKIKEEWKLTVTKLIREQHQKRIGVFQTEEICTF